MSKKLVWVAALMGLALATNAHAEAKIAVVDFNHLLNEWSVTKTTMQALQNEFVPRQRDLQQKEKDLQAKADRLQRDGAVMSQDERDDLQRELTKGQRDLKNQADSINEDFESRRNEEGNKLQGQLVVEVQNYAKANGYDMVLSSNIALYVKDTYNITPQVLTYLQGHAPAADTKPKAAPAAKPAK